MASRLHRQTDLSIEQGEQTECAQVVLTAGSRSTVARRVRGRRLRLELDRRRSSSAPRAPSSGGSSLRSSSGGSAVGGSDHAGSAPAPPSAAPMLPVSGGLRYDSRLGPHHQLQRPDRIGRRAHADLQTVVRSSSRGSDPALKPTDLRGGGLQGLPGDPAARRLWRRSRIVLQPARVCKNGLKLDRSR